MARNRPTTLKLDEGSCEFEVMNLEVVGRFALKEVVGRLTS
jgi:hypothetical protein